MPTVKSFSMKLHVRKLISIVTFVAVTVTVIQSWWLNSWNFTFRTHGNRDIAVASKISENARERCRNLRNGKAPLNHSEFIILFRNFEQGLPLSMASPEWIDILCPIIRFDAHRKNIFEEIYSRARWRHGNASIPLSGSGSTIEMSASARSAIVDVLEQYNLSSIVDLPCGDLTWMRMLFPYYEQNNISYTGIDIVPSLIRKHEEEFLKWKFLTCDYVDEVPVSGDLIFNREALQHINFYEVFLALHHFSISGSKYLLSTSYEVENSDNLMYVDGTLNTIIQLHKSPYCLQPIAVYEDGKPGHINRLRLFKLPLIRSSSRPDCS